MRAAVKLLTVLAVILLFSAWAAPLLFKVLPFEYERIMNRLIVGLALITLYVMYIRGHERDLILFGFRGGDRSKWFASGLIFGLATVVFIVLLEIWLGARQFHENFSKSGAAVSMARAFSTGLAVGVFEEWFFRGFLLKSFRRGLSLGWAVFWMNFLYSLSHFIEVGNLKGGAQASFMNSLKLMLGFFSRFQEPFPASLAFIGLVIFGYLLTGPLLKTGSLYMSMGIHAGVVTALKTHNKLIQPLGGPAWFFGDDKYYNGVLGWLCLLLSWFVLTKIIHHLDWGKDVPQLVMENRKTCKVDPESLF